MRCVTLCEILDVLDTRGCLYYNLTMAEEFSPILKPQSETESERQRRVFGNLPQSLQDAARTITERVPALRDLVEGNPHKPVVKVVGRIRDAIRPSQS